MKLANLDDWEPHPGDLFIVKGSGATSRKQHFIVARCDDFVLVLSWHMNQFSYQRYALSWFAIAADFIAEVHRP